MTLAAKGPGLVLIAAVARDGVIGDGGRMPWHLPADVRHFKAATLGCPVIMGRKTWDSLPERFRPLPGRRNLVLTRQPGWAAAGAETCADLDDALARARQAAAASGAPRIFVIGGAELYRQALPVADELLLTEIDADAAGDTRFPPWDRGRFTETRRDSHPAAGDGPGFAFVTFQRNR